LTGLLVSVRLLSFALTSNTLVVASDGKLLAMSADLSSNPYRLPRTVTPTRYDLTIAPDLGKRDLIGRAVVTLTVNEPIAEIVCNAAELTINRAWIVDSSGARNEATNITLDATQERVTVTFGRTIAVGEAKLTYEYTGTLNDRLAGFYASTWTDDTGTVHVIAATQFEATDARKAFPCWDEPDLKAVFASTLVVADGLMAISNEPIKHETVLSTGKRSVTFHDTMIMSTYLVCFVIGDLKATDPIDVDGVPLRIIHRPGQEHLTAFALEIGEFSLRYFSKYYAIPYPGRKMDLIALPDFAAGAMENLGAVTFRETLLLIDPQAATHVELERLADVVAHEIAHMWFGDLVTMSWWNGLWLNEAFATFAEISCVAAFRPEWDRWTSFGVFRSAAMTIDALHTTRPIEFPVISPDDADGMFDVLTYEKGASVLRQLEQYLGEERFRDGVRHYLNKHAYGNSETSDLFDAIEHVTGEPVAAMMNGWIFTGGFPIVTAVEIADSTGVTITQERFTFLPGAEPATWQIPVIWRAVDGSSGRVSLGGTAETIDMPGGTQPTVINAGGHGFYRVRYDDSLLMRLSGVLDQLTPIERFGVVNDTWAAVMSGALPSMAFLRLAESMEAERDPSVWSAVLEGLSTLNQVVQPVQRSELQGLIRRIAQPVLNELTWSATPGETTQLARLRGMLIEAVGGLGADPAIRAICSENVELALNGSINDELPADVASAVIDVAARSGDLARWEQYRTSMSEASTPQLRVRMLRALGGFEDPDLRQKTLALLLTDEVRGQDVNTAMVKVAGDWVGGPDGWAFMRDNWEALIAKVPATSVGRMVESLVRRTESDLPSDIRAFFHAHPIPQAIKQMEQNLERLAVHERLRDRERQAV
jgi:puromycin-sensitive aminopeptidase